jgi:hypothetical protein
MLSNVFKCFMLISLPKKHERLTNLTYTRTLPEIKVELKCWNWNLSVIEIIFSHLDVGYKNCYTVLLSFQLKCSSNIDSNTLPHAGWPIHFIKFLEIFIHFLWKSQFQVFYHFWSLPFYLWLVSCTNNKGDWCIQTIQQELYNYTRKCMNISRNLIKWIGQPEVMYWMNIWGTLQLERQ